MVVAAFFIAVVAGKLFSVAVIVWAVVLVYRLVWAYRFGVMPVSVFSLTPEWLDRIVMMTVLVMVGSWVLFGVSLFLGSPPYYR